MSTQTGPALDTPARGHAFVPGPKGLPLVGNLPQFGKNPSPSSNSCVGTATWCAGGSDGTGASSSPTRTA